MASWQVALSGELATSAVIVSRKNASAVTRSWEAACVWERAIEYIYFRRPTGVWHRGNYRGAISSIIYNYIRRLAIYNRPPERQSSLGIKKGQE
jgi:hypothetical protein